jgi:hypothetical protein
MAMVTAPVLVASLQLDARAWRPPATHQTRESGNMEIEGPRPMALTVLTVLVAGALGGAIAAHLTAIVIIATVALTLFGAYNGLRIVGGHLSDLSRD